MNSCLASAMLLAASVSSSVLAQTSVTPYGFLGVALRSSTNADPDGNSKTELTGSNLGAGYWGLRGAEDLGGGLHAHFKLESGFFLDTGAQRNNGLFGREASVGLDGDFGKIDVGRLQVLGNASEPLVRADPYRGAGGVETVWPGIWTGARFDNALRYRFESGHLFGGAMLSLGERSTTASAGNTSALTLGYAAGPLYLVASCQSAHDGSDLHSDSCTAGATYLIGRTTLHGAYLRSRRDKGFVVGAAAGSALFNTDLGLLGNKAPAEVDSSVYLLGVTVNPFGKWRVRGAYFYGDTPHATLFSATRGGTQQTAYAALSYEFSEHTQLMGALDWNRWTGGWAGFWGASAASLASYHPDGSDTRRGASLAMVHTF